MPYLRCFDIDDAKYVSKEIHKEYVVTNYEYKALSQEYYWPMMHRDSNDMLRNYKQCQKFTKILKQPLDKLTCLNVREYFHNEE